MNSRLEKTKKLENVARLYYEQNKTQAEIARVLGVSRPLVSRMLQQARDSGIVEIRIHTADSTDNLLLNQLRNLYGLKGAVLVPDSPDDHLMNEQIGDVAFEYAQSLGGGKLGVGWGHVIGGVVSRLDTQKPEKSVITDVCPLVGNSKVSIRFYHSNENVRAIAHYTKAEPHFLHTPAFAESAAERELLQATESFKDVQDQWNQLDVALVNIGNYPSSPDFASVARYGNRLTTHHAVGRLVAYYYNIDGEIIESDADYALQIPVSTLAKSKNVVGVCSANVSGKALAGALNTGLFHYIVARESLVRNALDKR